MATRKYEKKRRAEQESETGVDSGGGVCAARRDRAARTTINAIAERGVERLTVYRHFADRVRSSPRVTRTSARSPPPNPAEWADIADPGATPCGAPGVLRLLPARRADDRECRTRRRRSPRARGGDGTRIDSLRRCERTCWRRGLPGMASGRGSQPRSLTRSASIPGAARSRRGLEDAEAAELMVDLARRRRARVRNRQEQCGFAFVVRVGIVRCPHHAAASVKRRRLVPPRFSW
jgi:hypothetical protein